MESRAHHILVGAFLLTAIVAAFAFVIWLARLEIDRDTSLYDIYFEESVSGLTSASAVLYKGVEVGTVETIAIDPESPERVRVTVEIEEGTPIRADAVATLSFQGITGVSNIELSGGTADTPPLTADAGEERPVIPSEPSPLQSLLGGAPDLLNEISILVDSLQRLTNADNRKAFGNILTDIEEITGGMAFRAEIINRSIENMDTAIARMTDAAATVTVVGRRADELLQGEVPGMLRTIRSAAGSIDDLARELNSVVESERGAISRFTGETLPEIGRAAGEARRLTETLNRIARQVEEHPSDLLFSPSPPEYRPQ